VVGRRASPRATAIPLEGPGPAAIVVAEVVAVASGVVASGMAARRSGATQPDPLSLASTAGSSMSVAVHVTVILAGHGCSSTHPFRVGTAGLPDSVP